MRKTVRRSCSLGPPLLRRGHCAALVDGDAAPQQPPTPPRARSPHEELSQLPCSPHEGEDA
eukprot:2809810-Alexandrium_andersonii.AAC.1